MSATIVNQTAFNRGELDPALYGRWDWQSYFSGAAMLRNMICRTQGGALKRAGTEFLAETLDPDKPSYFIRFRFAVTQTYMLEFADRRFRVFMDGGVVVYPAGHALAGLEVVLESPYSYEQLRRVRVAQTEDLMVFTHPDHQPRTLTRRDHHVWIFEPLEFGETIVRPEGVRLTRDGRKGHRYVVAAVSADNEESLPSDTITCGTSSGVGIPVPDYDELTIQNCRELWLGYGLSWPAEWDAWNMNGWELSGSAPGLGLLQKWLGYHGYNNRNGMLKLTRPDGVRIGEYPVGNSGYSYWFNEAIYALNMDWGGVLTTMRGRIRDYVEEYNKERLGDGHNTIAWDAADEAVRYRIYREHRTDEGAKFMLVGTVTGTTFDDDNLAFVNSETPQTSNNPFVGPDNYPGVCTFYQQRLILARTNNKPNTVWGSRVGAYRNFNRNDTGEEDGGTSGISDTSSFEHTFQAEESNEILWVKPMDDLLFGTAGGEFRMGGGSYIITPSNVSATRQSNYGCSDIAPVIVGQDVVGVGYRNRTLSSYRWNYSDDGYKGTNLSDYAGHLFKRREIAGIANQFAPDSLVWAVMSDGALLSFTYLSDEDVRGWTRHDTDGRFEAVALMTDLEGDDEIWFVVAREINGATKHYIERMKEIQHDGDDIVDAWYVDCGLSRNGAPVKALGGLEHLEGKKVVCLGDGFVFENLTVVNGTVTLPRAVRKAVVGLPYTAELRTVDMEPAGGGSIAHMANNVVLASVLFYHSRECLYAHDGGVQPVPLRFQTEDPTRPIKPVTVRKNFLLPKPIDDNRARLHLTSPSPVPFGVLSATLEVSVGQANPGSGRPYGAA